MPTRERPSRQAPPLSPAWRHILLVGEAAEGRVAGWLKAFRSSVPGERDKWRMVWDFRRVGDVLWQEHHAALTAEATAAGFAPFWATKKKPTGAAFEQWRQQFLDTHSY